jgi:cation-transporting ATPase E
MQDILKLFLTRITTMAMVIFSALVVGEFPLELRQGSLVTLFSVGVPSVMLAIWARPGSIGRGTLPQRLFHFVLTPVLVTTLFALLIFYGTLVYELYVRAGFTFNLPPEIVTPLYPGALFTAQSTLVSFMVLVGLVTIIFVEPPTEWWTGGDELSNDWKPALLAVGLMIVFFVILFLKPVRDIFVMAELGPPHLVTAVAFALVWLFLVRFLWRKRVVARYLGIKGLDIDANR